MYWPFWHRRKRSRDSPPLLPEGMDDHEMVSPADDARDRGPAKYFHGRSGILAALARERRHAEKHQAGNIFLVQGAPGAGKTALLAECAKRAESKEWQVVEIDPDALWDPTTLRKALKARQSKLQIEAASAQAGALGVGGVGITARVPELTTLDLLQHSGKEKLLLILDEAQRLGDGRANDVRRAEIASNVLTRIHNGELGRPVILLAGGLGTSRRAFEELGISRFERKCLRELGRLTHESERAILRDWLTKDGGAAGDVTPWIDAIAHETHGWPQHIMAYVDPAVTQLYQDAGKLTLQGLDAVLCAGRKNRVAYYLGRLADLRIEQRRALAQIIATTPPGKGISYTDILKSLTRSHEKAEAEHLFEHALHKGVLAADEDGRYAVPIPSMHDWLLFSYLEHPPQVLPSPAPHLEARDVRSHEGNLPHDRERGLGGDIAFPNAVP